MVIPQGSLAPNHTGSLFAGQLYGFAIMIHVLLFFFKLNYFKYSEINTKMTQRLSGSKPSAMLSSLEIICQLGFLSSRSHVCVCSYEHIKPLTSHIFFSAISKLEIRDGLLDPPFPFLLLSIQYYVFDI